MNKPFKTIIKNKTLKYNLFNKFLYKTTSKIPRIQNLIICINQRSTEKSQIAMSNLALEVLFFKKSAILTTKRSNLLLKVKKNQPTGCKLIIYNNILILQSLQVLLDILKTSEQNIKFKVKKHNSITINIRSIFNYEKLENFFLIFYKLKNLSVSFKSNLIHYENTKELNFLISYLFCCFNNKQLNSIL